VVSRFGSSGDNAEHHVPAATGAWHAQTGVPAVSRGQFLEQAAGQVEGLQPERLFTSIPHVCALRLVFAPTAHHPPGLHFVGLIVPLPCRTHMQLRVAVISVTWPYEAHSVRCLSSCGVIASEGVAQHAHERPAASTRLKLRWAGSSRRKLSGHKLGGCFVEIGSHWPDTSAQYISSDACSTVFRRYHPFADPDSRSQPSLHHKSIYTIPAPCVPRLLVAAASN
jgi:hypothetical protein